jgi:hypothetical protein
MAMTATTRFLCDALGKGLEVQLITPDDVLKHVTCDVLARHLPSPLVAKLLTACLEASRMDAKLIVDVLGVEDLCVHMPVHVVWAVIAEVAQRALGSAVIIARAASTDTGPTRVTSAPSAPAGAAAPAAGSTERSSSSSWSTVPIVSPPGRATTESGAVKAAAPSPESGAVKIPIAGESGAVKVPMTATESGTMKLGTMPLQEPGPTSVASTGGASGGAGGLPAGAASRGATTSRTATIPAIGSPPISSAGARPGLGRSPTTPPPVGAAGASGQANPGGASGSPAASGSPGGASGNGARPTLTTANTVRRPQASTGLPGPLGGTAGVPGALGPAATAAGTGSTSPAPAGARPRTGPARADSEFEIEIDTDVGAEWRNKAETEALGVSDDDIVDWAQDGETMIGGAGLDEDAPRPGPGTGGTGGSSPSQKRKR